MNRFKEAGPRQMRKTTRVIAVCLVGGQRSQRLVGLPALDADHRQAKCRQAMKERRGHSARLEQNALNGRTFRQGGGDCFRHGWRPDLKNDLPLSIDDADMRLFHRDVQSGKMLHGCSPLHFGKPILSTFRKQPPITRC